MKKLIFFVSVVAVSLCVVPVLAEESPSVSPRPPKPSLSPRVKPSISVRPEGEEAKKRLEAQREEAKQKMEAQREEAKQRMETQREEAKQRMEAQREEAKQKMEEHREEFKEHMEERKAELAERLEKKREDLKKKLEVVKDERKKKVVERVDTQIDELNARLMSHFSGVVDKIEEILNRIEEKAAEHGVNVSSQVTAAEGAIAAARTAIANQSGKTYEINVSSEENLRSDVGTARQKFRADLKVVHDAVKAAQKAVRDVAVALGQAIGTPAPSPTTSPTASPSSSPTPTASPSPSATP